MKKIFVIIMVSLISINLFAQNSSYKDLVSTAKSYEAKGQWAYALGFYADAIASVENPSECEEAFKRYEKISESIEEGNPGLGEYKGVKLFNGWKNLLIDAEQYWSEYCPYDICIGNFELQNVAGSKADYRVPVQLHRSSKYFSMIKSICKGFSLARNSSWDLPKVCYDEDFRFNDYNIFNSLDWPVTSVSRPAGVKCTDYSYPIVKAASNFMNNGVPTYSSCPIYTGQWSSGKYITKEKGIKNYYNAFAYTLAPNDGDASNFYLYDLKIKIVDENGKNLVEGKRVLPQASGTKISYVNFKGLTMAQAEMIDNGKAVPVVEEIYLQYGYQSLDDYLAYTKDMDNIGFKKNLPEISISLKNAKVYYADANDFDMFCVNYNLSKFPDFFDDILKNAEIKVSEDGMTYTCSDYDNKFHIDGMIISIMEVANIVSYKFGFTPYYNIVGNHTTGSGFEEPPYSSYEINKETIFSKADKKNLKKETLDLAKYYDSIKTDIKIIYNFGYCDDEKLSDAKYTVEEILEAIEDDDIPTAREKLYKLEKDVPKGFVESYANKIKETKAVIEKAQKLVDEKSKKLNQLYEIFEEDYKYRNKLRNIKSVIQELGTRLENSDDIDEISEGIKKVETIDFSEFEKAAGIL